MTGWRLDQDSFDSTPFNSPLSTDTYSFPFSTSELKTLASVYSETPEYMESWEQLSDMLSVMRVFFFGTPRGTGAA